VGQRGVGEELLEAVHPHPHGLQILKRSPTDGMERVFVKRVGREQEQLVGLVRKFVLVGEVNQGHLQGGASSAQRHPFGSLSPVTFEIEKEFARDVSAYDLVKARVVDITELAVDLEESSHVGRPSVAGAERGVLYCEENCAGRRCHSCPAAWLTREGIHTSGAYSWATSAERTGLQCLSHLRTFTATCLTG